MTGSTWRLLAVMCCVGWASTAWADDPADSAPPDAHPKAHHRDKCPKPSYSCCHYWLPSLYTFRAYHSPPCYVPEPIDPALATVRVEHYHCPPASPANQAEYYSMPSLAAPVVEKTP
jgi:hypothetical protein